jgi:hypothetical protein
MDRRLIGYDPLRIDDLRRHTLGAVDSLRYVGSADPGAEGAVRAVGRTTRTLTELWLPLLERIAASTAMLTWDRRGPHGGRLGDPHERRWETFAPPDDALLDRLRWLDDDELLDFLEEHGERLRPSAEQPLDLDDAALQSVRAASAAAIDDRLDQRPSFADELVRLAPSAPAIALAIPFSVRRHELAPRIAATMLAAEGWRAELHPATYPAGIEGLLRDIALDPTACLTLLRDDAALARLAAWDDLDGDLVRTVVRRGLLDAVHDDAGRLPDGYGVLRRLTELANGELDGGFVAGMARGVGDAFVGYVDTFGAAISDVSDRVVVPEAGDGFLLGSYGDVVDLLGAVAIDPIGQAALGVAVGAHLDATLRRIAAALEDGPLAATWLAPPTRVVRAVGEAILAEGHEAEAAAAAAAARQRRLGTIVGFTTGVVGLIAPGPIGVVLSVADKTSELVAPTEGPRPAELADLDLSRTFVREARFGMITILVRHPRARSSRGLGQVPDGVWEDLERRVGDVERLEPDDREDAIAALDREIRETVPALDRAVTLELDLAGVDELRRDHSGGDPAAG